MARGTIHTAKIKPEDKSKGYTMSAQVMYASIRNNYGEAFIHVGENHIQVVVTHKGQEVLRQVWTESVL